LIVAHVDLDAFFAAVEELDDATLRTKPLVVGGDPHGRGVVATANYEARRYGIHSAMSCAEALRRCRHAVFLRPRHSHYRDVSRRVWATIREVAPAVQQTGIDEGYLDLTEQASDYLEARALAEALQTAVRGTTQLTCSLGVSSCKVVAKIASDRRKPAGITVVPAGREREFLAPLDVRKLPGVGPRAEERLRAAGVTTIGALASLADRELGTLLPGKVGLLLRDRARGIDRRRVELSEEPPVSISHEETFDRDVADRDRLYAEITRMSTSLAERLRERGLYARTVTTKLRYGDFTTRTRSETVTVATDDAERIRELACALLDRALEQRAGALRLVGVAVSGLQPDAQLALV
jgi:DNA polymerase-4